MKLFNWRIRNKLLVGFSLVLFLMAAIGGYTFIYSRGIEQQTSFMSQTASMNLDIVEKLKVATIQVQQFLTDASATGTTDGINESKEWAEKFRGYVNEMHTKCTLCHSKVFKDSPKDMPDVEAKIIEMSANFETYYEIGKKMTNIYIKEGREAGNKLMPEFDSAAKKINKELDRRTQMAKKHFTKSWNDVNQSTKRAREWTLFIVLAAVAIGILVAFFIAKKIENPVADVVKMADKIAQGDLTCKDLNIQSGDEMELLAASLNKMKGTLNEIMQHVVNGVTHLASASEQLSASSTQIAKGTDEQTQRASTVATASEEMSATIIEVAKNASGAAEAAKEANNLARNGGDIVQKTVEGMNDIAKSVKDSAGVIATLGERSREIGKIIKVIDDIADQTNLLALNAAIEAARAGEQGRGFAVVADEVRKLAERTTKATKEIGDMIQAIQNETRKAVGAMEAGTKEVEREVRLAKEAGEALGHIVGSVDKVSGMIQQIATAAEEQSTAADQISGDIEAVAGVAKQTADGANQIVSASSDLAGIASKLQTIVSRFKIDAGNAGIAGKGMKSLPGA